MLRTRRSALVSFSILLLAVSTVLAQEVEVEKYQLPNGMTVILHEDHSAPAAAVNIWYYVASKDEPDRRSGFAHLFEHLMFMGTERVPEGDFDKIMEAGGGFNNASTSEDRTNYFSYGPSELLPTLLWLDADRLEALGGAMTHEKLEKQRAVVRNERRQNFENRPYGVSELRVYQLMFPEGHPYHRGVIGSHEDLEAATVEDVQSFFATYYLPSNASLVIAGDFNPANIKPVIEKWFGTLPRGSDVVHPVAPPVALEGVRRLTMTDKVQFARTTFVYHSPGRFGPGDAEMDLAGNIMADGISSRLYQRLVYKDKLAVDVSASQESMLLGSLFRVEATASQGADLGVLEAAMDEVIGKFSSEGPEADEIEKQKAKLEYSAVRDLQSILRKADRLNAYQFHFGEPDSFKKDLDRYRNATAAGVREWAASVLAPGARLVLRVIPEIEAPAPSPRDGQPGVAGAAAFIPPLPESFKLSNGIQVHHWRRSGLPLVAVSLLLPPGSATDPRGKAGLGSLTLSMLDEGAGERGAVAFADALDLLGADLGASVDLDGSSIFLSSLTRTFDRALDLLADAVRRPRFEEKEWERVHTLQIQDLIKDLDEPNAVASKVSMSVFFGEDHPYGRPVDGTPESVKSIALADVRSHYAMVVRPEGAVILSAGDMTPQGMKAGLERALGGWKGESGAGTLPAPVYGALAGGGFRVALVDRPGAVQSIIRFLMPGPVYADPGRKKLQLFGTILGGSFTSRLNQNLREEHGYAYGAGCGFTMSREAGYFAASSRVRTDVTGASISEFLKEFRKIGQGDITAEEARKARSSERMDMIQAFSGLNGVLAAAATLVRNGRPFTDLGTEMAVVAGLGEADLNGIAKSALRMDGGLLLLVGDLKLMMPQIEGLGLPAPIEFDVVGKRIEGKR